MISLCKYMRGPKCYSMCKSLTLALDVQDQIPELVCGSQVLTFRTMEALGVCICSSPACSFSGSFDLYLATTVKEV